ncbi:lysis system i-spanin subunit Rz [Pseudomonas sp. SLFW]|uniref:lysis system i-spanin subunit Rz n=1 Tax=Pseudomonas sp. SLFW TaxID=2683259 RepID=UPI0014129B10|nr:lysis system i-spanin subunit Rz [Pseudomonas sp. SLFW]NBB09528.1 lysis protein [Pseudomonas sp. SLFW]
MISPRILGVGTVVGIVAISSVATASGIWQIQDWRYGHQLERQARLHHEALSDSSIASAAAQLKEQHKRLAVERRLQISEQTHHKELSDAQKGQKRLLDRLATADLRLSVVLSATDREGGGVSATTSARRLDHGTHRAELDPAHAQRIVGITDDGDRGLIALRACQAYLRTVTSVPR